jgi:hypothetical protein
MRAQEIQERLHRRPFEPFRFFMSDGSHYDVPHPELALVGARAIAIAIGGGANELPERTAYCDPLHVTRIEPIPPRNRGRAGGSGPG